MDVNDNQNAGLVAQNTTTGNTYQGVRGNGTNINAGFNAVLAIPEDFVQEFRVTVSGRGADQGRSSGGQVVLIAKSGTNQLHGSLYEYNRNTATSANTWFNNQAGVPVQQNLGLRCENFRPLYEANGLQVDTTVPLNQFFAQRNGEQSLGIPANQMSDFTLSYALNGSPHVSASLFHPRTIAGGLETCSGRFSAPPSSAHPPFDTRRPKC